MVVYGTAVKMESICLVIPVETSGIADKASESVAFGWNGGIKY
jgi:hypothetical protein